MTQRTSLGRRGGVLGAEVVSREELATRELIKVGSTELGLHVARTDLHQPRSPESPPSPQSA